MPILSNGDVYETFVFNKEENFEETVEKLSDYIFGPQTIYLGVKKRLKTKALVAIPDAYLIDMTIAEDPRLYVIENEIVRHDPFKHIGIQMLKFVTGFEDDQTNVRNFLMEAIAKDSGKLKRLEEGCAGSTSRNIDNYLDKAVYRDFKGIVLIDEARPELHKVLEKINADISVLEIRTYVSENGKVIHQYDSLYEEDEEVEVLEGSLEKVNVRAERMGRQKRRAEADTIIVPAREDGFKKEFLANCQWYAIRIGAAMKDRIRYIAAYQVAPISAVTHVAEVQEIKPYQDTGKYIVLFKGQPEPITHVPVKDVNKSPQGPIYVRRDNLLKAKYLEQALEA